jgi:hypothetical protein
MTTITTIDVVDLVEWPIGIPSALDWFVIPAPKEDMTPPRGNDDYWIERFPQPRRRPVSRRKGQRPTPMTMPSRRPR